MGAVNLICGYKKGIILNRDADGRDGAFEGFNDPFGDWIFQFRLDGAAEIPGTVGDGISLLHQILTQILVPSQ